MKKLKPVYFALDFETGKEALSFLEKHGLEGVPVKVGMELFYKEGPQIIKELKKKGHHIFVDLKLHDIPVTVRRAMKNLASLEVDVVNVHAQGGLEMMKAAKQGLAEGSSDETPLLFAVTMLTSTDQAMVEKELLLDQPLHEVVRHLSELTEESGANGVVCSVQESELVKSQTNLLTLTPGIRLEGGEAHDQKRVATPAVAFEKGSNSIVVGRAIRDAAEPYATYQMIKEAFQHGQTTPHS